VTVELLALVVIGLLVISAALVARGLDQRRLDATRNVYDLRFPRTVNADQVSAFLQSLAGLATPRLGLRGRDTAVLEVVGDRDGVHHRLRLPHHSASYFLSQLRVQIPGVAVTPFPGGTSLVASALTRELRLPDTAAALAAADGAAISRTFLSAVSGLEHGDRIIWQVVIGGGGPTSRQPGALAASSWTRALGLALSRGTEASDSAQLGRTRRRAQDGLLGITLRLGAEASTLQRRRRLLARLQQAAGSVSAPGARLLPRALPNGLIRPRLARGATPVTEPVVFVSTAELVALAALPIGAPNVPGLALGGSPQLLAGAVVPSTGRVLGDTTAGRTRPVAQPLAGALEHTLITAPTGSGKSWLAANIILGDIAAGYGGLVLDPKGSTVRHILRRLPGAAVSRVILIDPSDEERPVPLPLLAGERGTTAELTADGLIALLQHRYSDLGPRSTDILSSSLYALARVPGSSLFDLLPLWSNPAFRARVVAAVASDPVQASFWSWFEGLGAAERNFVLAAPMNKIRPLLARPVVRNILAAPRATFSLGEAMAKRLVVLVALPEGQLGADAASLIGQVLLARAWSALQRRTSTQPFLITVDEAPRFVDLGLDLAEVLARSREYGVGVTLIGQSLQQFPPLLREVALNSARSKVAFGTSAGDARRLAEEFGPTVTADMLMSLAAFEAIAAVSTGGTVTPPFTLRTRPLAPAVPGREAAVRRASRDRYGVPRAELEAVFTRSTEPPPASGPVGRRTTK